MGLTQKGLELKEGTQQPLRTTGDDAHHLEEHDRDSPLRTACTCVCAKMGCLLTLQNAIQRLLCRALGVGVALFQMLGK